MLRKQKDEEDNYDLSLGLEPDSFISGTPLERPGLLSFSVTEDRIEFDRGNFYFEGTINPEGTRMEGIFEAYHYRFWPEEGVYEACGLLGSGTWSAELEE